MNSNWVDQILIGDCLTMMKQLPDNSVDMVCTDPPYFLDGLDEKWDKQAIDKKGASGIIKNLPKGMRFDRNQSKNFTEFYQKISTEVFRILKPGGFFLSFSSPRLYHSLAVAVESAGFEIRDMIGWIYTQSQVKAFSQNHIIDKDKKMTNSEKEEMKRKCENWKTPQLKPAIEPVCVAVKPLEGRYIDNFQKYGVGLMNTFDETRTGQNRFPSNVVSTETICEELDKVFLVSKPSKLEKKDYNTHLSVKPLELISHFVKLFTQENALVLDPFMGSGTTAVACKQANRRFIGFDINEEYAQISKQRLSE